METAATAARWASITERTQVRSTQERDKMSGLEYEGKAGFIPVISQSRNPEQKYNLTREHHHTVLSFLACLITQFLSHINEGPICVFNVCFVKKV